MKSVYFSILALLIVLSSCSADDVEQNNVELVTLNLLDPVLVTNTSSTRSAIDKWGWEDFYFYVCKHGTMSPAINSQQRVSQRYYYSYWETPINVNAPAGQDVDVYVTNASDYNTISPDNVRSYSGSSDFLYAEKQTIYGVSITNRTVNLKFHHAYTCIRVRLASIYKNDFGNNNYVYLYDSEGKLPNENHIDITTGEITTKSYTSYLSGKTNTYDIPVYQGTEDSFTCADIMFPEMDFVAGNLCLEPDFNKNRIPKFVIPSVFKDENGNDVTVTRFERGKRYTITLLINNRCLIEPVSFLIEDWVPETINLKL